MSINVKMTAIADEIRTLSGITEAMGLDTMASTLNAENTNFANNLTTQDNLIAQIQNAVDSLPEASGEPVLQTKTVTPTTSTQNVTPDGGYDGLSKVTVNAMPTATQATPTITVSSSGLITASATQTTGYVTAGTKSGTKQLTAQAAKTITPSTSSQTAVAKNVYTTGAVTVGPIPPNYEDVTDETNAYTTKLASLETAVAALESELEGKASGGSSNGVEVEVITITETGTSQIPFTLKRVTKTIGSYNGDSATGVPFVGANIISSHINTYRFAYSGNPMGTFVNKSEVLTLNSGKLVISQYTFAVPYVAVFINDPTQPAIYEE